MTRLNKTFIIRHRETKEQWVASSGKSSWKQKNHASCAWVNSDQPEEFKRETKYSWKENMKFSEQDVYEIIELLPESDTKLQEACKLLSLCVPLAIEGDDLHLEDKILTFLEQNWEE